MMPPRATDPNAAMLDAVARYLMENLPEPDVARPTDFAGAAEGRVFCIEYGDYSTNQLELGRSVYEDRSAAQLITLLDGNAVAATLLANPDRRLVIATTATGGIRCEVRELRR